MTEPSLYKNFKFLKGLKGGGDTQKTNWGEHICMDDRVNP